MRNAQGFAPQDPTFVRRRRIAPALVAAALMAALACYVVPRGIDANSQLAIEDDPSEIAGRALEHNFDAELAQREIAAALATKDAELAQSFLELSAARHVTIDPALTEKVKVAVAEASSTQHAMESFALGLATGEPSDQ